MQPIIYIKQPIVGCSQPGSVVRLRYKEVNNRMKFCDKLQKIRKENNLTQEALADKLDVSRQAVSKWESGTAYPDTEKLIQISQIFNVSLDELINDNKEVNKDSNNKRLNFKEILNVCFNFVENIFSMFFN